MSSFRKTQPPPCVRSQPSNGFRDAAFVWSWLLGVSVKQGSFTLKLHDQKLWKKVSIMFHAKKFPEIQSFISMLPSDARSAPLQTHSPATDSSTQHQKRRLGLEFIGLEQVSGINRFDNEIFIISGDSKWYKVCFR